MSNKLVKGKDVIVKFFREVDTGGGLLAIYVPIICAKSCTITRTSEVIEKTSWASTAKEFTLGMYEWEITLEGVLTLEPITLGDVSAIDLFIPGAQEAAEVTFDADGTTTTLTGNVIVPAVSFTGDVSDFASYSLTLKGTGEVTIV